MDKILYSPKEGTTGFWGLRDVKMTPRYPSANQDMITNGRCWDRYEKEVQEYNAALESCKEKKLEIVNPEELPVRKRLDESTNHYFHTEEKRVLKPGDIFDLPIGYEFKEELQARESWHNHTGEWKTQGPFETHGNETRVVLRLVKTETEDKLELPDGRTIHIKGPDTYVHLFGQSEAKGWEGLEKVIPQPEPEESQTELFSLVYRMMDQGGRPEDNFTIQRKKQ